MTITPGNDIRTMFKIAVFLFRIWVATSPSKIAFAKDGFSIKSLINQSSR
jgi:hypothetical protein